MGLDMYLYGVNDEHMPIDKQNRRTLVCYWRKANAIHRWFVENVQDGVDDCGIYIVSVEQLKELLHLAKEALASSEPANFLPTMSGFFFGGTDYGEWYREDLKHTIKTLSEIIRLDEFKLYEYHAWW